MNSNFLLAYCLNHSILKLFIKNTKKYQAWKRARNEVLYRPFNLRKRREKGVSMKLEVLAGAGQTAGHPHNQQRFRPRLIGQSPCMQELKTVIKTISPRTCTVLIHGETGSGKEMVARQIHSLSPRASKPFVPIDCTTLRDTLFESQLFGHVKGAFTGADQASVGFFRAADTGTLFFDEIGELQP
jgi:transcriptional regulator with GAF, ATPase, and Fis domain